MKQFIAIALALVLTFGLCACGRKNKVPATTPTTVPATTMPMTTEPIVTTTEPMMDPTLDTNIPDPSVDTSVPEMTDLLPTEETTPVTDPTNVK